MKARSFIHSNNFTVIHGNGTNAFYFTEKYYSGNIITTKQTKLERNKRSTHMEEVLSLCNQGHQCERVREKEDLGNRNEKESNVYDFARKGNVLFAGIVRFIPKSRFQSRLPTIIFILYHAIQLNNLVLVCSIWNNKRKNMSRLWEWKRTAKDSRLLHITQLQKPKTDSTWEYLCNKISYSILFNTHAHNWANGAPWKPHFGKTTICNNQTGTAQCTFK